MRILFAMLLPFFLLACAGLHKSPSSGEENSSARSTTSPKGNGFVSAEGNEDAITGFPLSGAANSTGVDSVLLDDYSSDVDKAEKEAATEPPASSEDVSLSPEEKKALESDVGLHFELDVRETKEMQQYFKYYTHRHRKTFARWLKRSEPYLPYIKDVLSEYGLPDELIFLPFAESGFNPWAYSRAGAAGLWQFIPATGRRYGLEVNWWIDERRNPYKATEAAAKYLKKLYNDFGDWYLALAAYNAGEGRVSWALRKSGYDNYFDLTSSSRYLHRETRLYVPKLMAILKIVKNLEKLGFDPLDWDRGKNLERVQVKGGTDLLGLCTSMNMSWEEFRKLNPAFRRQVTPPYKETRVYVPRDRMDLARSFLDGSGSTPYSGYSRYQVSNGDSWWRISRRFGIPISVLKQVNNRQSNLLRPGQSLMIPHSATAKSGAVTKKSARRRANYTVRKGDTLWGLSRRFDVGLQTLYRANGISNPRSIRAGDKIYIPDLGAGRATASAKKAKEVYRQVVRYRVRNGDTLWDIARRFGVRTRDLQKWNGLSRGRLIHPGDRLKIYVD
jgi:membrane-bound lytic murein transglycosylase D